MTELKSRERSLMMMKISIKAIKIAAMIAAAILCTIPVCADVDESKEILLQLPHDENALAGENVAIFNGTKTTNASIWYDFLKNVAQKTPDVVVTARIFGSDVVLDRIEYDGSRFTDVRDNSANAHFLGENFAVRTYCYLLGYENGALEAVLGETETPVTPENWDAAGFAEEIYETESDFRYASEDYSDGDHEPFFVFRSDEGAGELYGDSSEINGGEYFDSDDSEDDVAWNDVMDVYHSDEDGEDYHFEEGDEGTYFFD